MQPGPELDALIAEHVMGWKWYSVEELHKLFFASKEPLLSPVLPDSADSTQGICFYTVPVPAYSTSIQAAWKVVEKLKKQYEVTIEYGLEDSLSYIKKTVDAGFWLVNLREHYYTTIPGMPGKARTAPHAICLAALSAVGFTLPSESQL